MLLAPLVACLLPLAGVLDSCGDRGTTGLPGVVQPEVYRVTPRQVTLAPGERLTFHAILLSPRGDTVRVTARWSATGGRISSDGEFTAPTERGTYQVIARASNRPVADTAEVVVVLPVARLTLDPDSIALPAGRSALVSARAFDVEGNPVDVVIRWESSDATIASIPSQLGIVSALGEGRAVLTAHADTASATVVATVGPAVTGGWPNEPVGFHTVSDQPWDLLSSLSWVLEFGTATIGLDLAAPWSPPGVLAITYPAGFAGGSAPGTMEFALPSAERALFAGLWWKPSDPWDGHPSNVNKIQFLFPESGGDMTMVMYGSPGGPYELRTITQFPGFASDWMVPNRANVPVRLGVWHQVEWLVMYGANGAPGLSRWWLDGTLIGDYTTVAFPAGALRTYKLSPTWGGVGGQKKETDVFWFDHVYLSVP
jgi:hypothetical protein